MANTRIQAENVIINNIPYAVQGETITMVSGEGEINVEAHLGSVIHGVNSTTKIGMFKFELAHIDGLFEAFQGWKQGIASNVINIIANDGTIYTQNNASITNDPEFPFSSDGNLSIESSGDPILF